MRSDGSAALDGYGFNPREGLRRAFRASVYARTAMVEGRPIAMWGIAGGILSDGAYVWLVLSDEVRRLPKAIVREARAELALAAGRYRHIAATVLPEDEASLRFALHLGFGGDGDDDVLTDPKYRIPTGDGYAIRLTYQPGAH